MQEKLENENLIFCLLFRHRKIICFISCATTNERKKVVFYSYFTKIILPKTLYELNSHSGNDYLIPLITLLLGEKFSKSMWYLWHLKICTYSMVVVTTRYISIIGRIFQIQSYVWLHTYFLSIISTYLNKNVQFRSLVTSYRNFAVKKPVELASSFVTFF